MNKLMNLENCRRTYAERGCKMIELTHLGGGKSAIVNEDAIGVVMDALKGELDRQIRLLKGEKEPKKTFVILSPSGEFYREVSASLPKVMQSFTAEFARAKKFDSREEAIKERDKLCAELKDGNGEPLKPHLFPVAEMAFRTVG